MISVRASRIPILLLCPPSHADGFMQIDTDNELARLGDASHEGAAAYVRDGSYADAEKLADLHRLPDVDELERMLAFVRIAWDAIKVSFPAPIVEQQMAIKLSDDVELTGKSDILSLLGEYVIVGDWKSGYRIKDFFDQLRAYALLASEIYGKPKWSVTIFWLRDRVKDTKSGTTESLQEFKQRIIDAVRSRNDQKYRVSDSCEYCPRFFDCPARRALVKQSSSDILGVDGDEIRSMALALARNGEGSLLTEILAGIRCIQKACENFKDQVKAEIDSGGAIPTADGGKFDYQIIEKRILDALKAWPAISSRLTAQEIASCMRLSLSKLSKALSDKTGRGQKKAAIEAMTEELSAAGAITEKSEKRLKEFKPNEA